MKKLFVIIILSLSFITSSKTDDIKNFEIDGISLGESLLNYYSEKKIKKFKTTAYQNLTDEYFMISGAEGKTQEYEALYFHVKKGDDQYIIHSLGGYIYYKNFNECLNKKKKVVNSLKSSFGNLKPRNYDYKYDWDLKSIAYISDFDFKNGAIRVYCVNWSEDTENKRSFADNLSVNISADYFNEWLNKSIN